MDNLKEIIFSFKEDEAKQVRKFISRKSNKKDRKDLLLFDLILKNNEYSSKEIMTKIYNTGHIDAFHQLRRNLYKHIEDYICQQNLYLDIEMRILKYLLIANSFFNKKLFKQAWKYLFIAEKKAKENEQFNLLSHIYNVQLANTFRGYPFNVMKLIEKNDKNQENASEDNFSNTVFNLLRYDLKKDGKQLLKYDIDKHTKLYLKNYKLIKGSNPNPKLEFPIIEMVCNSMIEKDNFKKLEPYILSKYNELLNNNVFDKSNHQHKLKILEIVSYTLLKNKKYNQAEFYHDILQTELLKFEKKHYNLVILYSTIRADIYTCSNRINKAIALLEQHLNSPLHDLSASDQILLRINLTAMYFSNRQSSEAIKMLFSLQDKDKEIIKYFGVNHLLIKHIAECLIHTEQGNHFYVENRIKAIRRKYSSQLDTTRFQRDNQFLSILMKIIKDEYFLNNQKFIDEVKYFIKLKKLKPAASEFISYNAWLQSKLEKRTYYDVFLEMVSPEEELLLN